MFNDALPQFRTTIRYELSQTEPDQFSELKVHFVHKRSTAANALPLLFCHGWPGSFTEVLPIIGALTEPADEVIGSRMPFHVVAASIPGFGFSDASSSEDFGPKATAAVYDALMQALGYEKYIAHGDKW